jgi:hypothetical protein
MLQRAAVSAPLHARRVDDKSVLLYVSLLCQAIISGGTL